MQDIRQSLHYADYLRREGWTVERANEVNYFIKKLPVLGSILKIQRPKKIDFEVINKLARKYRIFQIIIEPNNLNQESGILNHGFKLSKSPYLPTKTLQIDLTQSQKAIFSHFKKDARSAVKKAIALSEWFDFAHHESKGGGVNNIKSYSTDNEIKIWRKAWKNSVNFTRFVPGEEQLINLRKSFSHNSSLFLASHNISGSIMGGALFTISSHERSNYISYYWYGFANHKGRTSLSQYSLLWYGILWAKKQGCKIFDFEGIYDPRFPNKSWLGFTHFKKSFGGVEVSYPGCYTKFRLPI